ncbi:unnamed protein product, partial [Ceratitis capitata]
FYNACVQRMKERENTQEIHDNDSFQAAVKLNWAVATTNQILLRRKVGGAKHTTLDGSKSSRSASDIQQAPRLQGTKIPKFDPLKKTNTAHQFATKTEQSQRTYKWSDDMLLFAAQQKLKGSAKD